MYTANPFSLNDALASGSDAVPDQPAFWSWYKPGRLAAPNYGDSIDAFVQAMERDGLLRTLAEPTLTAISGESAKFLAGGEFPIVTAIDP
jgi:pilus assembly protein CpaC